MTITRWIPKRSLESYRHEMDKLWNSAFAGSEEEASTVNFIPPVDIEEKENAYHVTVELPGVTKSDIKVNINDNVLTIAGEKKIVNREKENGFHRVERALGSFRRCFRLPEIVAQDKISAEFTDGVLVIDIPKSEEALPKEIEVKVK